MNIEFPPGTEFDSYEFGRIYVRKVYAHETGEICLDVKSEAGDKMHLSLAYARKLKAQGFMVKS